jgi:galactosyl transferase GMA12/MNN10 family
VLAFLKKISMIRFNRMMTSKTSRLIIILCVVLVSVANLCHPLMHTLGPVANFATRTVKLDHTVVRLAVVSICCTADMHYANYTLRLNQAYCHLHQCDFIRFPCVGLGEIERVNAMLEILNKTSDSQHKYYYEYVMWMDCDAAFVNPHASIQDQVLSHFDQDKQVGMLLSRHYDFPDLPQSIPDYNLPCNTSMHVPGECTINSGVFVVRHSQAGMAALQELRAILAIDNSQDGFDTLIADQYSRHMELGDNLTAKVLYGEVMNRHIPPHYFDYHDPNFTVAHFREVKLWSDLPTLVVHQYGLDKELHTKYYECAIKTLLVGLDDKDEDKDGDGYIDYYNNTNNYTEVAIDKCLAGVYWIYWR